ncbi:MAG: hypothetical protein H6918_06420 [Sphingomonadaceae bacterium]|nr:hypothetical protein [Sphingomonadaceae bacterium]
MNARLIAAAPVLLLALSLAGCKDEPETAPAEKGAAKAAGDVKGGAISDAMIPLDQLKSKAPALKIDPEDKGAAIRPDSGAGAAPDEEDGAAEAAETVPAAEPSPEAAPAEAE